MFVSGVSTHKAGEIATTLTGVAPGAVSRLNQALTEQYEAWRKRRLLTHYKEGWSGLLQDLRTRGVGQIDLLVTFLA